MLGIKESLNLTNIRVKISDEQIFQDIFPNFKKLYVPFSTRKEKNPSSFITSFRGSLYFKDFGNPLQNKAETWYKYIQRINGWEGKQGYFKALKWANNKYNLNLEGSPSYIPSYIPKQEVEIVKETNENINRHTKIEIKKRDFQKQDLNYWKQFNISTTLLKAKGIYPLVGFWITNFKKGGVRTYYSCKDKLSYVYPYYRGVHGEFMYKIYQPLDKRLKWVSNVDINIVQNKKHIPNSGKLLIIQTSWKDVLVIETMGFHSIAPNNEGGWFTDDYWEKLCNKWDTILYFANNDYEKTDNPGLTYAKKYKDKYGISYISTPNESTSDISDYVKAYGYDEAYKLVINLLKDNGIQI